MDRQRTEGPSTLLERAATAAVAGVCGAALATAGCYTFFYGIVSQALPLMASSVASGTFAVLFLLVLAVAMSVGGGAILSKALGVSTWQRSTLISATAHAIGIPLWIVVWNYLTSYPEFSGVFGEAPLRPFCAAMYAFVVPFVVVFSSYREDAPGGLVVALFLALATAALPVASVLVDSGELALASGILAWVMLPAITVVGAAMIGLRNLS